ncbi:MAG: hypothetical protein IIA54_07870 [Chloroflexi bacterium]|nr:hypothetical protein [Chloroflexota bacterium]
MSDDGWRTSTEGDLDPDLTEEAGYAGWDPPRRAWLVPVARAITALLLAIFLFGLLLRVL